MQAKQKTTTGHTSEKEYSAQRDSSAVVSLHDTLEAHHPNPSLDASSIKKNLTRIENLYIKALIPEMEIMDKSLKELKTAIDYLENLKRLLKLQRLECTLDDELERCLQNLYERIDQEVQLYMQFTNQSVVSIEKILHEPEGDRDEPSENNEMVSFGYDHTFQSVSINSNARCQ